MHASLRCGGFDNIYYWLIMEVAYYLRNKPLPSLKQVSYSKHLVCVPVMSIIVLLH